MRKQKKEHEELDDKGHIDSFGQLLLKAFYEQVNSMQATELEQTREPHDLEPWRRHIGDAVKMLQGNRSNEINSKHSPQVPPRDIPKVLDEMPVGYRTHPKLPVSTHEVDNYVRNKDDISQQIQPSRRSKGRVMPKASILLSTLVEHVLVEHRETKLVWHHETRV